MADLAATADRVYRGILAPLVLGGVMVPGKPIGARVALEIGILRGSIDPDLTSHVTLGRIRRARQLAPVDRFEDATVAEWSLGCALHDLLQATHPSFAGAFRSRKTTTRLLALVDAVCERTPPPETVGEALSRHSWFARILEIARTDSTVSWWVGKSRFLGAAPPARLTAWPELRRVHVNEERRALIELPTHGGAVDALHFASSLSAILAKTPLTDLATCARTWPMFAWRRESIALLSTRNGRALALRALSREPEVDVDDALGQATRELVKTKPLAALSVVFAFLAERALASALGPSSHDVDRTRDARLARAAGALAARELVIAPEAPFSSDTRTLALRALERMAANAEGGEIARLVAAATHVAAGTSAILG
jgi:hypothetical protein